MAKKKTTKATVKKLSKPVAKYVGYSEVLFPKFNKIVKRGDLLPELSLDEAEARSDFIVINKEE
jgi:hypothetical protein